MKFSLAALIIAALNAAPARATLYSGQDRGQQNSLTGIAPKLNLDRKCAGQVLNESERKLIKDRKEGDGDKILAEYEKKMAEADCQDAKTRNDITQFYAGKATGQAQAMTHPDQIEKVVNNNNREGAPVDTTTPLTPNAQTPEQRAAALRQQHTNAPRLPSPSQPPPNPIANIPVDGEKKKGEGNGDLIAGAKFGAGTLFIGAMAAGPVGAVLFGVAGLGLGYAMSKEISSK